MPGTPKTLLKTRLLASRSSHFVAANISMANSLEIGDTSSNYYYFPHVTKPDYDRAFEQARQWALENLEESPITAARIYHVKWEALRKSVS
jgi:hypothetical protein